MLSFFENVKTYGIYGVIIMFCDKVSYRLFCFFNKLKIKVVRKAEEKEKKKTQAKYDYIAKKMLDKKYKYIFVFYPYVEWDLPIFQRPQQIALELTKNRDDVLYFYCSANCRYDNINDVYEKINDNLFIMTDFEFLCNVKTDKRIIHLYSSDTISRYNIVEEALKRKDKVLYEYIDEIHDDITHRVPDYYLEKHKKILKNEKCYVIATADKLYDDVKKVRKERFALSTNGVNIEDFVRNENDEIPERILELRERYEKILCYYGSLAKWYDYALIKKISKKFPKYAIVLIGLEYDDSFKKSNVDNLKNVYYLGKVNYSELHKYSENTDLLMIPFLINEITESTSPVKLFEYMATNIPILTTDMKECRKYKSVIIGHDHEDFINKIDSTIDLINNEDYLKTEMEEALDNTWHQKANIIIDLLNGGKKND